MFLTFLDTLIEERLKPEVFAFRKGRDVRMAVASLYFKLSRTYRTKQICVCSVNVEKCFDGILHDQIIKQYPFPRNYEYLLVR
jgi:retron-type reverse transcriptase